MQHGEQATYQNMCSFLHSTIPCCNKYLEYNHAFHFKAICYAVWSQVDIPIQVCMHVTADCTNFVKHIVQLGLCEKCCTWMYFAENEVERTKMNCSTFMWWKKHTIQSHIIMKRFPFKCVASKDSLLSEWQVSWFFLSPTHFKWSIYIDFLFSN